MSSRVDTRRSTSGARRTIRMPPFPPWLASLALFAAFLAGWEAYVHAFDVSRFLLPPPTAVLAEWVASLGKASFWMHTWVTVYETVIGFAVAVFVGVKSVSLGHREVLVTLNASRWQTFRQLDFPSALPYILTGMEMGVVLAIIGAVVGEYLGGNQGLGNLAVKEMNSFNTTALFAVIIHESVQAGKQ